MRVKTVLKRVVIGIAIFFAAIIILGVILQATGYQPSAKPEQTQPLTETLGEQADGTAEPQAPQTAITEEADPLPDDVPARATVTPLFGSVKNFRDAFNKSASMNNFNFQLPNLKVQNGEANNVFQCKFTDYLFIMGTVDKKNKGVKEITMMGRSDGTLESSTNLILCMAVIIASVDPSLAPEQRGDVLRELGFFSNDNTDIMNLPAKTEKNGLGYFLNSSPQIGIMFGVSRE
jgi:hypothetical protein